MQVDGGASCNLITLEMATALAGGELIDQTGQQFRIEGIGGHISPTLGTISVEIEMVGRDTEITDRVVMRPIKIKTLFLVVKRCSVGMMIGANTMRYFGVCAQPGLGSSIWGNELWPSRMAVATTPYHHDMKEWKIQYREEAAYSTVVSNVAGLSEDKDREISREATVLAQQSIDGEGPSKGTRAYQEGNVIEKLIEQDRLNERLELKRQQDESPPKIEQEPLTEFPVRATNLTPGREFKRHRKETSINTHAYTSLLVKVSKHSGSLNSRLGIGRSMCNQVGKSRVDAGLGVFTRVALEKGETICVLDTEIDALDPSAITNTNPNASYGGYINSPTDTLLLNCELAYDESIQRHILRASQDIEAQHEIFMRCPELRFTNGIEEGQQLLSKVTLAEEREIIKVATRAAAKLSQELKQQSKPRSYHQKLDERTRREKRALTIKELRHKERLKEAGKTSPGVVTLGEDIID